MRIAVGVLAFVVSAYVAYIAAFVLGAIFLPGPGLAVFLGFVGGLGGGYFAKAGPRTAALVGVLGGLMGAFPAATMNPYNPVSGGISFGVRILQGLGFMTAGILGALLGDYMARHPSPPGSQGPLLPW